MRLAVAIDRFALHELHREVRQTGIRDAAVDQSRDVRMLEPRQDAALLHEPAKHARGAMLDQLDGDALLELPIHALAKEHAPHPAAADLAHHAERTDVLGDRAADRRRGFKERRHETCGR
jgi:hypothetical protein